MLNSESRTPGYAERPTGSFDAVILVADDDATNRDLAVRMLAKLGCHTLTAVDGQEAVERASNERVDLILIDCEMPLLDGFQATAAIRRHEAIAGKQRTPIVALTSFMADEVRRQALQAGIDDIVSKPLRRQLLVDCLSHWVSAPARAPFAAPPGSDLADQASAIDGGTLADLRRMAGAEYDAMLAEVVAQFDAFAPPLAAAIRAAAEAGDLDSVWRAAHRLRSSAATLGALELANGLKEVEVMARDSAQSPSSTQLERLERSLSAAQRDLRNLVVAA